MRRLLLTGLLPWMCIASSVVVVPAIAQTVTSIDVPAEVNKLLAAKGQHRKQRVVPRSRKECNTFPCHHGESECTRCKTVTDNVVETYTDVLRVTDVSLHVVGDQV